MKQWLIMLGYSFCYALCASGWRRSADLWCRIWFHFYCPYPTNGYYSARDCVRCNNCGCNNGPHQSGGGA